MSDVKIILNEQLKAPLSADITGALVLDFSFDNFSPNMQLIREIQPTFLCTKDQFDVPNFVENWINDKGLQNGIPTEIQGVTTNTTILKGVMDLADLSNSYSLVDGEYALKIKDERQSFFDLANGLNLRKLYQNTGLTADDQIQTSDLSIVKYVLNKVPDTMESLIIKLTLYIIQKELRSATKNLAEAIADIGTGFTGFAVSIIKIAIATAYYIFIVAQMIRLLKDLSDALFAKPKSYYCTKIKTLFETGCKHLGYTFDSSIFNGNYANMVILPATIEEGELRKTPVNNPIPNRTLLELMNNIATIFNGKFKVTSDKVVHFENKFTYIGAPSNFILADLKNKGGYAFNLGELPQSINIRFSKDPIETNTYLKLGLLGINLTGKSVSSKGDEITVNFNVKTIDKDKSLLTEKLDVKIPFSRGFRKNYQTTLEKTLNSMYDIVSAIASVFGVKNPNKGNKVGDRIGYLLLNNDFTAQDKVFMLDQANNGKISTESFELIHSETIYNNFYDQESPINNQWRIITGRDKQPICNINMLNIIKDNNIVYDTKGRTAVIETNKRDTFTGLHELTYRVRVENGDLGFIPESDFTVQKVLE